MIDPEVSAPLFARFPPPQRGNSLRDTLFPKRKVFGKGRKGERRGVARTRSRKKEKKKRNVEGTSLLQEIKFLFVLRYLPAFLLCLLRTVDASVQEKYLRFVPGSLVRA